MHVLWLNQRADFVGGAERYVAETAGLLRERAIRSSLLYGAGGSMDPRFTNRFDAAFPLVALERQVAELAPDIIYAHQLSDPELVLALGKLCVPVVRFFHDHGPFCPRSYKYTTLSHSTCTRPVGIHCWPCLGVVNRSSDWPGLRLRTVGAVRTEQRHLQSYASFVVGSRYMYDHVVAHGFDPARVHVIPPFVRSGSLPTDVPRDGRLLLFVGALLRGKGLDILLRAMTYLERDVRLLVTGAGHQQPMFQKLTEQLTLTGRVSFRGKLIGAELQRAYLGAACTVIPSREPETFCLVGPEALLCETPVVASRVGGVGEWLEDGVTGRSFPTGDAVALAGEINRVLGDPEHSRRLAEAGRARVIERFSPDLHVDRLTRLFESLRTVGARVA